MRALWELPLLLLTLFFAACAHEPSPQQQAKTATEYLDRDHQHYQLIELASEKEAEQEGGWRRIVWRQGARDEESLTLTAPPQRIVSQSLGADEVLVALGLGDRLLAISELAADPAYSPIAEVAQHLRRARSTDAEGLLALRADLVFTASYATPETLDQLRRAGAPVLRLAGYESIDDAREKIRVIGFAVGRDAEAEALVAQLDADLDAARRYVAQVSPAASGSPRIVSYGEGWVRAGRTLFDDVVGEVGAINVASEKGLIGWPRISAEQVARWDFDAFLLTAAPGHEEDTRRIILDHPALRQTRAAKSGRLIVVPNALADSVSHHLGQLALAVATGLYGDREAAATSAETSP